MRYGTAIRIGVGPIIPSETLKTIGVFQDGQCWGVWIHRYSPDGTDEKKPHLIISPIPPESWPFVFQLRLKLTHERGSLEKVSRQLALLKINIIYSECVESGHNHATWNVVCEHLGLKDFFKGVVSEVASMHKTHREDEYKERTKTAAPMTIALLSELARIKERLQGCNKDPDDGGFLYDDLNEPRMGSFKHDYLKVSVRYPSSVWTNSLVTQGLEREMVAVDGQSMWDSNAKQIDDSVTYSLMPHLIDFFRSGENVLDAIEFHFQEKTNLLETNPRSIFLEKLKEKGIPRPLKAAVSFITDQHYARLRFLEWSDMKKIFVSRVDYSMSFGTSSSSLGLFNKVMKKFVGVRTNLLQVHNIITGTGHTSKNETGTFQIIGETEDKLNNAMLSQIEGSLNDISDLSVTISPQGVSRLPKSIVFLSSHLKSDDGTHLKDSDITRSIRESLHEWGFDFEISESHGGNPATKNVIDTLKRCSWMIQVYSMKEHEHKTKPDLSWLLGEYLAARALDYPVLRLVNLDDFKGHRDPVDQWRKLCRFEMDRPIKGINMGANYARIHSQVNDAIAAFTHEIRLKLPPPIIK